MVVIVAEEQCRYAYPTTNRTDCLSNMVFLSFFNNICSLSLILLQFDCDLYGSGMGAKRQPTRSARVYKSPLLLEETGPSAFCMSMMGSDSLVMISWGVHDRTQCFFCRFQGKESGRLRFEKWMVVSASNSQLLIG